jgi:hypothetical protein
MPSRFGDEKIPSPAQKAFELSKCLPRYIKKVTHLNQLPVFTQATMDDAIAYFQRNKTYDHEDVLIMIALALKGARENPAPPDLDEHLDPYFWSRRFAHKPNQMFGVTRAGDLRLAMIEHEVEKVADEIGANDEEWAIKVINSELALAEEQ